MTVEPRLDLNALAALEDLFGNVDQREAEQRRAVHNMIADTEETIAKSSRERVRLVMDPEQSKKRTKRISELNLRNRSGRLFM